MNALLSFPNVSSIPHSAPNSPHPLGSPFPFPQSALPPRRTGKVARLTKAIRNQINRLLDENTPYPAIIAQLGEAGKDLNPQNISNWAQGGYQDYLRHQDLLEALKDQLEFAKDLLAQVPDPGAIFHALRLMAGLQLSRVLFETGQKLAETDPAAYARLVRTICSLSAAERQYCQDRHRQAQVEPAPAKPIDYFRPLTERETQLIRAKLDEMCGYSAEPSRPIKPDQASVVESHFQRAGQGGFQPPVSVPSISSSIKPDQTSAHPVGTDSTPSQTMTAIASASSIKVDQSNNATLPSPHSVSRASAGGLGQGEEAPSNHIKVDPASGTDSTPSPTASAPASSIKADQAATVPPLAAASAPSLESKVRSSELQLPGSPAQPQLAS